VTIEQGHYSIYDGRDRLGSIVQRTTRRFDAFDQSGGHLGTFDSVKAASAALSNPRSCTCVRDPSERGGGG
jgi:hypothetical protein